MNDRLRIGEIAALCGVTRDTIRFYERSGLLGKPQRTASQHRVYSSAAVEQVRFVRRLQSCGLTIGDIQEVIGLAQNDPSVASSRLMKVLRVRLEAIEARVAQLEGCRERLTDAMQLCAKARSNGYAALSQLPHTDRSPPAFMFGRRASGPSTLTN